VTGVQTCALPILACQCKSGIRDFEIKTFENVNTSDGIPKMLEALYLYRIEIWEPQSSGCED
jgi:hypothetical protein